MKKIGLALSGGGFRASLFHLGLVRFLRDAGLLSQVSHITSVSGGSVMGAHLALNWDRYNSSAKEFDSAAAELLAFVRLDVRNRILRRFLLNVPVRWGRKLAGLSNRKLSRVGLLEQHYEKFLYGDTSLFELPRSPQLHILATNLSEGCLCSFNRSGLIMIRRQEEQTLRLDRIRAGLATVPMAVTASSAFPAFFPPLELTGSDVGVNAGEFGRQAYTDGGVFDNLGVRMFRCLERPLLAEGSLSEEDFVDWRAVVEVLARAGKSANESALGRLTQILVASVDRNNPLLITADVPAPVPAEQVSHAGNGKSDEVLMQRLSSILRHYPLQREPLFAGLEIVDLDAHALLHDATQVSDRILDVGDQLWLNRHLLEAAFHQATGHACFRRLNSALDGVLVSDVGKAIQVQSTRKAGGVIRTALRSSDILMDRVWQLENETFKDVPGFNFARITQVVEPDEDPTALHPEIQRQAPKVRTDLDRFSPLEISSLVRHGYCVARKTCRAHPELFGTDLPASPPWDPYPQATAPIQAPMTVAAGLEGTKREAAPTTVLARSLQSSSVRRIWGGLLDYRDWTSYVYVPIIVPLLLLAPYLAVKIYQRTHRTNQLIQSLAQGSPDFAMVQDLLDRRTVPYVGVTAEEVLKFEALDYSGFEFLQDSRVLDMRAWKPGEMNNPNSFVYGFRRLKVRKIPDNNPNDIFRVRILSWDPMSQIRFPPQQIMPVLRKTNVEIGPKGEKRSQFEADVDFSRVPPGESVDVFYEHISPGEFLTHSGTSTTLSFDIRADTAEVTRWFLLPEGHTHRSFGVVRYKTGMPAQAEPVRVVSQYLSQDSGILAYKMLAVKGGFTYEVTWHYE